MSGRAERSVDVAAERHGRLLAALLDHAVPPWQPGELPPLGHWLLFPPDARHSELGEDGHPRRDDDGLPRRMWAGSRIRFLAPIALGSEVVRETKQVAISDKVGRSGRMQLVTLRHRLSVNGAPCLEEEQDIVYRAAPTAGDAPPTADPPRPAPAITRTITAGAVLLFRYSALTFNAHRIHYDAPYATQVEGYPALVVHGPLIATLLLDHWLRQRPGTVLGRFEFRARRPIFAGDAFTLGFTPDGTGADLVAIDRTGSLAMQAQAVAA